MTYKTELGVLETDTFLFWIKAIYLKQFSLLHVLHAQTSIDYCQQRHQESCYLNNHEITINSHGMTINCHKLSMTMDLLFALVFYYVDTLSLSSNFQLYVSICRLGNPLIYKNGTFCTFVNMIKAASVWMGFTKAGSSS